MHQPAAADEQVLIGAEELARDLDAFTVLHATVAFPKPRFDGDYRPESGHGIWREAHIPGSLHADLLGGFSAPNARLHFTRPTPDALAAALAELGVTPDAEIVVYDEGGTTWASRLWWMLRNIGVRARVLDGGFARWTALGLPVETGDTPARPAAPVRTGPTDRGLWRDREDVLAVVTGDAPGSLVCALDAEQFAGTATTRYARRGHITGSRNLPAKSLLDEGLLRPVEQVAGRADAVLAGASKPLILYCGGGVSACLLALALVRAGHEEITVYDGSLEEWTADPALPMTTLTEGEGGS
ncbi:rhodanese-like domain-containing protein [Rhodococcus sp. Z13]|uniref:Rhodanese-like domain-containing protein n=1 Tax=Rhodococcus sacchari TaxID=2962047 RepID=A0ACD4DHS9_9NOCA|nr:rhodanese-like domain-containing protein [Rhodococcus sp. Z13]UYP19258.1 rhodanese-like domain-containing protein [Rhodococcus sp. Z13]